MLPAGKEFLLKLLLVIYAAFAPIHAMLGGILFLVAIDLGAALKVAHKRGEPIQSKKLRRTLTKSLLYISAVVVGFVAEHYVMADAFPVSRILGSYIGLTELKSLFEHGDALAGQPLLKGVINALSQGKADISSGESSNESSIQE